MQERVQWRCLAALAAVVLALLLVLLPAVDGGMDLQVVPLSGRQHVDEGSERAVRPVLVATLNGHLHGLEAATGRTLWVLDSGPILQGAAPDPRTSGRGKAPPHHSRHPVLLPDPVDGSLFVLSSNGPTSDGDEDGDEDGGTDAQPVARRVKHTVQELARAGYTFDGRNVYLGELRTQVFGLDPTNGSVLKQFTVRAADGMPREQQQQQRPPASGLGLDLITIGRKEYTVVMQDRSSETVFWNMTFAEFASSEMPDDMSDEALQDDALLQFVSPDEMRRTLVFSSPDVPTGHWDKQFDSPIVGVYTIDDSGHLMKRVLMHEGGAGSDSFRPRLLDFERNPRGYPQTTPHALQPWRRREDGSDQEYVSIDRTPSGVLFASSALAPRATAVVQAADNDGDGDDPTSSSTALSRYDAACNQVWSPACLHGFTVPVENSGHSRSSDDAALSERPHRRSTVVPVWGDDNPLTGQTMKPPLDPVQPVSMRVLPIVVAVLCVVVVYLIALLSRLHQRQQSLEQQAAQQRAAAMRPIPDLLSSSDEESDGDEESEGPSSALGSSARHAGSGSSQLLQLGKLVIDRSTTLGHGSHGTVIHKGTYEGMDIAVKRVLREFYDVAHHEVNLLRRSDDHPNVVRYYCLEEDGQFLYIGLELCIATLVQVVEGPSVSTRGTHHGSRLPFEVAQSLDRRELARDFLSGLAHLHSLNIVHRDVKPHNVLLSPKYKAMISDFGLCAALHDNQSSFQTSQAGTTGWVAPEMLRAERMTKAVDLFSAGCVIHYLLHGCHPFGAFYEREMNIRKGKRRITKSDAITDDLLLRMLSEDPDTRPTAVQALNHPFFWTPSQRLTMLMDLSDRIEKEPIGSKLLVRLEKHAVHVVGVDWRQRLDPRLLADLERFRKYNYASVADLLRALRNKRHHYRELDEELQKALGDIPEGFLNYFTSRFERLFMHVYLMIEECLKGEPVFRGYF